VAGSCEHGDEPRGSIEGIVRTAHWSKQPFIGYNSTVIGY
jgi:hypothetical protein